MTLDDKPFANWPNTLPPLIKVKSLPSSVSSCRFSLRILSQCQSERLCLTSPGVEYPLGVSIRLLASAEY